MSSTKIKLGVIGYGNSAKNFHLPLITHIPEIEVYAILQRTPPAPDAKPGEHCTVDFPAAKHFTDVDSFFADDEIELVLVAVAAMHYEYVKRALLEGKNVIVEKAFTTTSAEADDLIQTAKSVDKIVTVYHNRRFDGDFLTVQYLVKNGVLGDLIDFETHFDWDDPGWPSIWADEAHRDGARGSAIDDWHTLILQYAAPENQGLVVTIRSTQIGPSTQPLRFLVRGRQGSYIKFHHDMQEAHVAGRQFSSPLDPEFGKEDLSHFGELTTTSMYDASFQALDESGRQPRYVGKMPTVRGNWLGYYQNIARSLRGQEELIVTAEQGRGVIRLFELARESARTGRSVSWS
ncbi:hypothetical protein BGZ61DRAFT_575160 [Ilyonectria robusta]|uniref:uncharacterized protein n=1 Tax=Ilyonectria robusta TaxID=1079257 RepID=UPI001E8D76A3|nr:uncharacterized protein BGZ61DRAFT_575160 [Ilyonectria robusta]KAH8652922.1 hypothetical protein BGZ61DRAFT_575160 [Ilyonectria robusta]